MNKIISLAIIMLLTGCEKSATVSPNYLLTDATKSIEILTDDNRIIKLSPGDYTVKDWKDSAVVYGKGILVINGKSIESKFEGSINFRDITQIEVFPTTSMWVSTPVAGIALSLIVIMIYLSTVQFNT